MKDIEVLDPSN